MSDKIKVLHIVGDPVGGIRKHIHDILHGLSEEFELFYVSSRNGDAVFYDEIEDLMMNINQYKSLHIPKRPSIYDLINLVRICYFVRKNGIDVIHGHGSKGGLYCRLVGRVAGCKTVYTPHGGVVHSMFGRVESILYRWVERFLCMFTDLFIFESNYTANTFDEKFACKETHSRLVNYNGIDLSVVLPVKLINYNNSTPKKLGVFGVMRSEKGQDIAYQVVKDLILTGRKLELHFFGEGPLREILYRQAIIDKVDSHFFFHGEVNDVYSYMRKMDFVLIPSRFESFGYVAVEAGLSGVPVISSNVGGLKEVLSETYSFLFDVSDRKNIGEIILCALEETPESLFRRAVCFREELNRFSLDKMLSVLAFNYSNLLNKS